MSNKDTIIERVSKACITECHDDDVGLWFIYGSLKDRFRLANINLSADELRHATMQVINNMLQQSDIVAMNYLKPNYYKWNLSSSEISAKIDKEWNALSREPNLGDIVFFISNDIAQKILNQNK